MVPLVGFSWLLRRVPRSLFPLPQIYTQGSAASGLLAGVCWRGFRGGFTQVRVTWHGCLCGDPGGVSLVGVPRRLSLWLGVPGGCPLAVSTGELIVAGSAWWVPLSDSLPDFVWRWSPAEGPLEGFPGQCPLESMPWSVCPRCGPIEGFLSGVLWLGSPVAFPLVGVPCHGNYFGCTLMGFLWHISASRCLLAWVPCSVFPGKGPLSGVQSSVFLAGVSGGVPLAGVPWWRFPGGILEA
jgi:hypothetical protein